MPRGLVFVASGWIVVSWLIVIGAEPPLQPTTSAYTPAAEMLVMSMAIGAFVAWPLHRLTTAPRYSVPVRTMLETVALVGMALVVLWPLRLVTTWSIARVAWLDAEILCTLLLIGGLTVRAAGRGSRRTIAMVLILLWILGPPALAYRLDAAGTIGVVSPIVRVWNLTQGGGGPLPAGLWMGPILSLLAAIVLWAPSIRRGLARPAESQ